MVSESSIRRYRTLIQRIGVEEARQVAELPDTEWRQVKQILGVRTNKKQSVLKQRNMLRLLLRDLEREAEHPEQRPENPRAAMVLETHWNEEVQRLRDERDTERRLREEAEQRLAVLEEEVRRLRESEREEREERERAERDEQDMIRVAMEELERELSGYNIPDIVSEPEREEELTEEDFNEPEEVLTEEDFYVPEDPLAHLDQDEREIVEGMFPTRKESYQREGMEIDKYRGQNAELVKTQFIRDYWKNVYKDGKIGVRFEYIEPETGRKYSFYKDFRIKNKSIREIEREIEAIMVEAEERYGKNHSSVSIGLYR